MTTCNSISIQITSPIGRLKLSVQKSQNTVADKIVQDFSAFSLASSNFFTQPQIKFTTSVDDVSACGEKEAFTILALPAVATDCEGSANIGSETAGDEKESEAEGEQAKVWKLE